MDRVLDACRRLPPLVADVALTAVLAVVTIVGVVVESRADDLPLSAYGMVLLAGQLVPLAWRRRAPVVVVGIVLACTIAYGMASMPDPPIMFPSLLALYSVAAYRPRSISVPVALVTAAAALLGVFFGDATDLADVTTGYFTGITSLLVGDAVRAQRERATWLDERRADEARQAARDERVRITRDLHDVVAHHVSVIAVQAEAAQEVLATQPERAGVAMANVADTARTALTELRRVLGVLRSDASLVPQPDLTALDDLVASVRGAGLPVTVLSTGEQRPVGVVVELTAYRVVQEALTNVLKHAGPCRAEVGLAYGDDELVVTVTDDGGGSRLVAPRPVVAAEVSSSGVNGRAADPGGEGTVARRHGDSGGQGQGLIGMRERVAVIGGRLDAGLRPGGGFTVQARLPLTPSAR